jgi:hypothetical protein
MTSHVTYAANQAHLADLRRTAKPRRERRWRKGKR